MLDELVENRNLNCALRHLPESYRAANRGGNKMYWKIQIWKLVADQKETEYDDTEESTPPRSV